jgi:hypothetical protein
LAVWLDSAKKRQAGGYVRAPPQRSEVMPTKATYFRCDECKSLFEDKLNAEICEERHEGKRRAVKATIGRNRSTPELRAFWDHAEACAAKIATWPDWKKASINYDQPGVRRKGAKP